MRFQEPRDGNILKDIFFIGNGILSRRHIKQRYWPDAFTPRAMEKRLAKLKAAGYIAWPSYKQRRTKAIPEGESLIWLGWRGILYVAEQAFGFKLDPPKNPTNYQLRQLQQRLREQRIPWRREPKWLTLEHDIKVIDCYMALERSVKELERLRVEGIMPESYFCPPMSTDDMQVEFTFWDHAGREQTAKKGVRPDFYVQIKDAERAVNGDAYRGRFLFEVDMSNHSDTKFAVERAAPYAAYIQSPHYKRRFGYNSGMCLVFTPSDSRMHNLMEKTVKVAGPGARYLAFTTFDQLHLPDPAKPETHSTKLPNLFAEPLWWRPGRKEPWVLLPPN